MMPDWMLFVGSTIAAFVLVGLIVGYGKFLAWKHGSIEAALEANGIDPETGRPLSRHEMPERPESPSVLSRIRDAQSKLPVKKKTPSPPMTLEDHDDYEPPENLSALPLESWLSIVNDKPDDAPHTLIIGNTGSGKTYLTQVVAAMRSGQVMILDPKWRPGKWGGAPAISIDSDLSYAAIEGACARVLEELKRRQAQLSQGVEDFTPLSVVVEELPTVIEECPTAALLFRRLGQLGRELRIRVIGLSTSDRVKVLRLEGEGDLRNNYTFIRLGEHAMHVSHESAKMDRPAVLEWKKQYKLIDTSRLFTLADKAIPPERWWGYEVLDQSPEPAQPAQPVFTDKHRRVAQLLQNDPGISIRAVARELYDGRSGGEYSRMAKEIMETVVNTVGLYSEALVQCAKDSQKEVCVS